MAETIDVPVVFGGVSMGRNSRRITVRVKKGNLKLAQARAALCRAELECKLICDPNSEGDANGQMKAFNDEDVLEATFETRSIKVDDDEIEFSVALSILKDSLEDGDLDHFAWTAGRLQAKRIGTVEKKQRGRPAKQEAA